MEVDDVEPALIDVRDPILTDPDRGLIGNDAEGYEVGLQGTLEIPDPENHLVAGGSLPGRDNAAGG
jgi:hypothetical protein